MKKTLALPFAILLATTLSTLRAYAIRSSAAAGCRFFPL
jgi:hypothetical protein